MEIGDVQKKDIMDHPENYTLLTTLDEGLFCNIMLHSYVNLWKSYFRYILVSLFFLFFSETWKKFKEEGENLSKASQTTICDEGIREVLTFLNPKQTEGVCSP